VEENKREKLNNKSRLREVERKVKIERVNIAKLKAKKERDK
jgi:hypothetical protein